VVKILWRGFMTENIGSEGAPSPDSPGWKILTPDVEIKSVDDLKNVFFENTKTGTVVSAYDYMMQQMGIAVAKDAQKQEEHRKKTMKELERA